MTVHSRDAMAVVDGESAQQLFALNDAADEDGRRLSREVTGQLEELFDGELRDATAAEIEQHGRERLAALAVAVAETWRQQRREAIEQALAAVDARLAAGPRRPSSTCSATPLPNFSAWISPSPNPKDGWPRAGDSSTPPARTWARPSCWPVPSAAASWRVRQADGQGTPAP